MIPSRLRARATRWHHGQLYAMYRWYRPVSCPCKKTFDSVSSYGIARLNRIAIPCGSKIMNRIRPNKSSTNRTTVLLCGTQKRFVTRVRRTTKGNHKLDENRSKKYHWVFPVGSTNNIPCRRHSPDEFTCRSPWEYQHMVVRSTVWKYDEPNNKMGGGNSDCDAWPHALGKRALELVQ